jgi:hypothetical protein
MGEFEQSFSDDAAHEMPSPNLVRKLARHCVNLCRDEPEVNHAFLVPDVDNPEQTTEVYIDRATTEVPYDPDSLPHRILERLGLADYFRPPAYNVDFYPSPERVIRGETAACTVIIDACNKVLYGETETGRPFSTAELQKYAAHILGIGASQETENLIPAVWMNRARTKDVLQSFADFMRKGPLDETIELREVTAEGTTVIVGYHSKKSSSGLMWHSPLNPDLDTSAAERDTPYVLRWRRTKGAKPGSILADEARINRPGNRPMSQQDLNLMTVDIGETALQLPIATHDAIIERFKRMLEGETTAESLQLTPQELQGLRNIAEDRSITDMLFGDTFISLDPSLLEQTDELMVFTSADFLSLLRLAKTAHDREYIAEYLSIPPWSKRIEQSVRAVIRARPALGYETLSREPMSTAEARAFVREALTPPKKTE